MLSESSKLQIIHNENLSGQWINASGHSPYYVPPASEQDHIHNPLGNGSLGTTWYVRTPDGLERALKVFKFSPDSDTSRLKIKNNIEVGLWNGPENMRADQITSYIEQLMAKNNRSYADQYARFGNEISALTSLNYPYIIRYIGFGRDYEKDVSFIAMDFAHGGSLADLIQKRVLLPPEMLVMYMTQIAGALDYAHKRKIIHRDVKPANVLIMIKPGERLAHAMLSDFDGAFILASHSDENVTQNFIGTASFMAPEQFPPFLRATERSDFYALVCTMYSMISRGKAPFTPDGFNTERWKKLNEVEQLIAWQAAHNGEPTPFSQLNLQKEGSNEATFRRMLMFAEEAFPYIRRGLSKDQNLRYQTGQEFSADIIQALQRVIQEPEKLIDYISISSTIASDIPVETLPTTAPPQIPEWVNNINLPETVYTASTEVTPEDYEAKPLQIEAPKNRRSLISQSVKSVMEYRRKELTQYRNDQMREYLQLAERELAEHNFEQALKFYERVINIDKSHPKALLGKGISLYFLRRYAQAVAVFDLLATVDIASASIAYDGKGDSLYQMEDYDNAIAAYENAIRSNPTSYHYTKKGNALDSVMRYEEAIKEYDNALSLNKDDVNALVAKGNSLFYLKRFNEAIIVYDTVIPLVTQFPDVYIKKGYALLELKRMPDALEEFKLALKIDPENETIQVQVQKLERTLDKQQKSLSMMSLRDGQILEGAGEYAKAIAKYEEAISLYTNNSMAHFYKGNVLAEIDDYEASLVDYGNALGINPKYGEAYRHKGDVLVILNRFDEALEAFNMAIDVSNQPDCIALAHKGSVLMQLQRHEEAIDALRDAVRQDNPKTPTLNTSEIEQKILELEDVVRNIKKREAFAAVYSGKDFEYGGNYQDALDLYTLATQLDPDNIEAWFGRGSMLNAQRMYVEAMEAHDRVIALSPDNFRVYVNRGDALFNLRRYDEALSDYEQAIDLSPTNVDALNGRGLVHASKGKYDDSLKDFEEALSIDSKHVVTMINIGRILRKLGKYTEAYDIYAKAISLEPRDSLVHSGIGYTFINLNQYERALEAFRVALKLDKENKEARSGKEFVEKKLNLY